jgi:hypothetical protein
MKRESYRVVFIVFYDAFSQLIFDYIFICNYNKLIITNNDINARRGQPGKGIAKTGWR